MSCSEHIAQMDHEIDRFADLWRSLTRNELCQMPYGAMGQTRRELLSRMVNERNAIARRIGAPERTCDLLLRSAIPKLGEKIQ